MQNPSKIDQNSAKERSESDLVSKSAQCNLPGSSRLRNLGHFGATWVILGAILGPAGRQGAPKIELFGTKSHQNLKKWIVEWGIKKYMKF